MISEITSKEFLVTKLTLNHDLSTIIFDMLEKLRTRHMLVLFSETNVAAEFRTFKHSMLLKFEQGFPDNLRILSIKPTFMWEFTEIDAITNYLVNFDNEITSLIAIWAAVSSSWSWSGLRVH